MASHRGAVREERTLERPRQGIREVGCEPVCRFRPEGTQGFGRRLQPPDRWAPPSPDPRRGDRRVPASAHRAAERCDESSGDECRRGRGRLLGEGFEEGVGDDGVELGAAAAADLFHRVLGREGGAVGAHGGHGVVGVADGEDLGAEAQAVAGDAVG